MLNAIILRVIKITVIVLMFYAECRYAGSRQAECHHSACHQLKRHHSECHYAKCHQSECRGAFFAGKYSFVCKSFLFDQVLKYFSHILLKPVMANETLTRMKFLLDST
jgi:hypothetical protein